MFKMKVGANIEDDKRRASIIREEIGWERKLAMDANQVNFTIFHLMKLEMGS
jgi:L-fuconate dehydratase